jgi:UDP-N-acetyl-D-galactosamine dehydrogenase
LEAANTKWNFIPFKPGLVGGHCIGICANYLAHSAEKAGYHPNFIIAGRKVNEHIPKFITDNVINLLAQHGISNKNARVGILGLTYKENCPDIHDTRIIEIINDLTAYGMKILVHDPIAEAVIAKRDLNVTLIKWSELNKLDVLIIMVAHDQYKEMSHKKLTSTLKNTGVIMDIKGILNPRKKKIDNIQIWRL